MRLHDNILKEHRFFFYSRYFEADYSGRAVWAMGLGRLDTGIVGSNPAQDIEVCARLSVLCCPVEAEALR
jgi:hypothetical protein